MVDGGAALMQARLPSSLAIKMHPAIAEARQLGFMAGLFSKRAPLLHHLPRTGGDLAGG
jgi:hypothetical protein